MHWTTAAGTMRGFYLVNQLESQPREAKSQVPDSRRHGDDAGGRGTGLVDPDDPNSDIGTPRSETSNRLWDHPPPNSGQSQGGTEMMARPRPKQPNMDSMRREGSTDTRQQRMVHRELFRNAVVPAQAAVAAAASSSHCGSSHRSKRREPATTASSDGWSHIHGQRAHEIVHEC